MAVFVFVAAVFVFVAAMCMYHIVYFLLFRFQICGRSPSVIFYLLNSRIPVHNRATKDWRAAAVARQ